MSSNEDVERLVDALIKVIPKAISRLFGRKIEMKVTRLERREIVTKIEETITIFEEIQRLKAKGASPSQMFKVLDGLIHSAIPEIPRDQHFVDWFIEFYETALEIPQDLTYLEATRFKDY